MGETLTPTFIAECVMAGWMEDAYEQKETRAREDYEGLLAAWVPVEYVPQMIDELMPVLEAIAAGKHVKDGWTA